MEEEVKRKIRGGCYVWRSKQQLSGHFDLSTSLALNLKGNFKAVGTKEVN